MPRICGQTMRRIGCVLAQVTVGAVVALLACAMWRLAWSGTGTGR